MLIIQPYERAVTLFGADGEVIAFKSVAQAFKTLGIAWIRCHVGRDFLVFMGFSELAPDVPIYTRSHYILRDDFGEPLVADDFEFLIQRRRRKNRLDAWCGTGPVPGTGKAGSRRSYRRRARYVGACRQAAAVFDEGELAPRAKRNALSLTGGWGGYYRRDMRVRSWKRSRKTRWHA